MSTPRRQPALSGVDTYGEFIAGKLQLGGNHGFKPIWMPDFLYDFQSYLVDWSCRKGRCAIFADCGLGKTPMQLVWAANVVRKTNKRVIIITPLAVGHQTVRESCKFGIHSAVCRDGKLCGTNKITVTNYERLHHFNPKDFVGAVCDESSILKNFDGVTRQAITEFMRKLPYRLLCTATAAPNDYIELGTSSEAVGELPYLDMLKMFFKSDDGSYARGGGAPGRTGFSRSKCFGGKFRFRGHAERDFWRWVCSWARALRKPSDAGFSDDRFELPPLLTRQHVVKARVKNPDYLFDMPAISLAEQQDERRRTLKERCEKAAEIVCATEEPFVSWCYLNPEGDMLEDLIPDAVQVSGNDSDERKEEVFSAFESGQIKRLISKPVIAGFGLNWQHCARQTFFPSHSFEQWYQAIRRCWRFGQTKKVEVDVITSEGEVRVLSNMQRKARAADEMFAQLVAMMNDELTVNRTNRFTGKQENPAWL